MNGVILLKRNYRFTGTSSCPVLSPQRISSPGTTPPRSVGATSSSTTPPSCCSPATSATAKQSPTPSSTSSPLSCVTLNASPVSLNPPTKKSPRIRSTLSTTHTSSHLLLCATC